MNNQNVAVKNRSNSVVVYSLPEMNIRRQFAPGETKQLTINELSALTYRPGGQTLIQRCLLIDDEEIAQKVLVGKIEPEYWLDEKGVKKLLLEGSVDEFLDCLDFAPAGVIELVKHFALALPVTDTNKRKALKDKFGYDVDAMLKNIELAKEEDAQEEPKAPERRVQKPEGRRTTPQYKIVSSDKGE